MIGRIYRVGRRSPLVPAFWGLLTLVLVVPALLESNPHWGLAAVLPGLFFLRSLLPLGRRMTIEVREEGLYEAAGERLIPYADIQSVKIGSFTPSSESRIPNRRLDVSTATEHLVVPAGRDAGELYRFLIDRIPVSGLYEVPDKLQKHWSNAVTLFGEEMVWGYAGRSYFPPTSQTRGIAAILALTFVAWIIGGTMIGRDGAPWMAMGIVGFAISSLVVLATFASTPEKRLQKLAPLSGLIISPRGLAMVHGEISGKLRWDEVRKIDMVGAPSFALARTPHGLAVTVDGATILVPDVFEKPLAKIHQQLLHYWHKG